LTIPRTSGKISTMDEINNTESEKLKVTEAAIEDLQKFLATAGRNTTQETLEAWQAGYISGVNRTMGIDLG